MIIPKPLTVGDKAIIIAPGKKINKEDVLFSADVLRAWGLHVEFGKNLFRSTDYYLSATDDERLEDLQSAINDETIDAIICARGGYGMTRLLDRLNVSSLQKSPKWIVGFSDITALHLLLTKSGIASVHGIMPVLFKKSDSKDSIESLRSVLFGNDFVREISSSTNNRNGDANGKLVGGNLSLICDSLGTVSEIETQNKILLLEEIDEYNYKIDRMITQLKRAGKFKNLNALIIGHFTDVNESEPPFGFSVQEIVLNAVKDYGFPVAFNFPSGHENPNLAWIEGGEIQLSVRDDKTYLKSNSFRSNNL